jgi:hypothetical protein
MSVLLAAIVAALILIACAVQSDIVLKCEGSCKFESRRSAESIDPSGNVFLPAKPASAP